MDIYFGGSHAAQGCFDPGVFNAGISTAGGGLHAPPFAVGEVMHDCRRYPDGTPVGDRAEITFVRPDGVIRGPEPLESFDRRQLKVGDVGTWNWSIVDPSLASPTVTGSFVVRQPPQPMAIGVGLYHGLPGYNSSLPNWDEFIFSGFAPSALVNVHIYRATFECRQTTSTPDCWQPPLNNALRVYTYLRTLAVKMRTDGQAVWGEPTQLGAGRYCFLLKAPPAKNSHIECERHLFEI